MLQAVGRHCSRELLYLKGPSFGHVCFSCDWRSPSPPSQVSISVNGDEGVSHLQLRLRRGTGISKGAHGNKFIPVIYVWNHIYGYICIMALCVDGHIWRHRQIIKLQGSPRPSRKAPFHSALPPKALDM